MAGMPRANRRQPPPQRLDTDRLEGRSRTESFEGRAWVVRELRASDSGKSYLCPGCQHTVLAAAAHIVTWPADGVSGIGDRRHWHTRCWTVRERRRPTGALL